MSWIFGFYSKQQTGFHSLPKLHPHAITQIENINYYISAGGNKNTLLTGKLNNGKQFLISGIPISEDLSKILSSEELSVILNSHPSALEKLNGHFCGLIADENNLKFFTDKLGLRELHFFENKNGWYFSSRLDWLLRLDHFEIDFEEFGSRWKLINQLSHKSIIKKIIRLSCGSSALLDKNGFKIECTNWVPNKIDQIGINEFDETLKKSILLGSHNNLGISLSLSGGMDSRVILSYLLKYKIENFDCHTFITADEMDQRIASKISADFNIKHYLLSNDKNEFRNIIPELTDYIGSTYLTGSGFQSRKLMYYSSLPANSIIIDGGFGEVWRGEFLRKLLYMGKNDLLNKRSEVIYKYLIHDKADLFNSESKSIMKEGIISQTEELFKILPNMNEIGIENWLDLFSLKTRLVNFYGQEQARLDSIVKAYMPFVQISLLKKILDIPAKLRNNSHLFRNIIKNNFPALGKYNLAKGSLSYPYWFSPLTKRIYFKALSALHPRDAKGEIDVYLDTMKEFTLDSINSKSVKEYPNYNYNLIEQKIISYYKGDRNYANFVDWFITFEIFRSLLNGKEKI